MRTNGAPLLALARYITERHHAPSGVAAFMSAPTPQVGSQHSCQPPRPKWGRSIHVSPHAPSGVPAFMSAHTPPVGSKHSCQPTRPQWARSMHVSPHAPVGCQHSCQPTVKLHILPLVWPFFWEMGSTGAHRGSSCDLSGHSQA